MFQKIKYFKIKIFKKYLNYFMLQIIGPAAVDEKETKNPNYLKHEIAHVSLFRPFLSKHPSFSTMYIKNISQINDIRTGVISTYINIFCKKSKYRIKPIFAEYRIRVPLVIFSAFLEKIFNNKIKCKLYKSRTKWTGLKECAIYV